MDITTSEQSPRLCCPICATNSVGVTSKHLYIEQIREIKNEYGTGIELLIHGECGHWFIMSIIPYKETILYFNLPIFDKQNKENTTKFTDSMQDVPDKKYHQKHKKENR